MPNIKANFNFRDAKKESPELRNGSVKVFFISEGKLYKGDYHSNTYYYEYGVIGNITCFANANHRNHGAKECTHWAYASEDNIIFE
jgi:hypothetical protein